MTSEGEGYAVYTTRSADRELERLGHQEKERMERAIHDLGDDPYPSGAARLSGSDAYRIRRGDYRAIYEVDEAAREVTVTKIGHRREVYKKK